MSEQMKTVMFTDLDPEVQTGVHGLINYFHSNGIDKPKSAVLMSVLLHHLGKEGYVVETKEMHIPAGALENEEVH
jgi:hypothetical protein